MKKVKARVSFLAGLVVFMAAILCLPTASWALLSNYVDFNIDGIHANASINYAGGAAPLVGTGISVDSISGHAANGSLVQGPFAVTGFASGIPINPPNPPITSGILDFTTGNLTSHVAGSNVWDFAGGGSIKITGGINAIGIADSAVLLSGSFKSAEVTRMGNKFNIAIGDFTDEKDCVLARYFFGITSTPTSGLVGGFTGNLNLSFYATGVDSFFSTSVLSGDVTNTPVPLPGAVWLLGAGLVGLVGVRRRMRK